ncbi:MAG: arginase family protein [Chitinophagaceae bacterium]
MPGRETAIIDCPSNLGLRAPAPGREPGVKVLPESLRRLGLHDQIAPKSISRVKAPAYSPVRSGKTGLLNEDGLQQYSLELAKEVEKQDTAGRVPLLLGGDCSIMIGAALALHRMGDYGLFYLDGHTDYMDIGLSQSGGAGGMAASMVTGYGPDSICKLEGLDHYINEENLLCAGNREYDDEYENEIRNSEAAYYPLWRMREMGMEALANEFLAGVKQKKLTGFWLHFDVDVLNDSLMPCVDSPTPDGLTYEEWEELMKPLLASPFFAGLSLTILDPELDPDDRYTRSLVEKFSKLWTAYV